MTAKLGTRSASGLARLGWDLRDFITIAVRRFPQRIRERRFWQVQAMMVGATLPHYVAELAGLTEPSETFRGLAITLYVIPLLYAAINFGWEGALLTALQGAVMMSPSMAIWHGHSFHWLADLGQLAITLPVGLLVAWRIDKETVLRQRAETTSARLALLNEIGERLSRTLEVEQQLPGVLRRLLSGLSLASAWLCLESETEGPISVFAEAADSQAAPPDALARRLHAGIATSLESRIDDRTAVIPLTGEGGVLGSLGVTVAEGDALAEEQVDLLSTIAHEIRVAVENARLYRERQESLTSYVRQVTEAQEEERLRIARELHDETAQELVLLVRKLQQLGETAPAEPVQELVGMARDTLQSVRRFSRDLRPPVLDDLGLLAAIEMVVGETNDRLPGGAQLQVSGVPRRLDGHVELALFRIAQEALRNVEKHAQAKSATVELDFTEQDIRLSVTDDGGGFSPPRNVSDLARTGRLGLLGMKERAELVGGSFELLPSLGEGTRVVVKVTAG